MKAFHIFAICAVGFAAILVLLIVALNYGPDATLRWKIQSIGEAQLRSDASEAVHNFLFHPGYNGYFGRQVSSKKLSPSISKLANGEEVEISNDGVTYVLWGWGNKREGILVTPSEKSSPPSFKRQKPFLEGFYLVLGLASDGEDTTTP